METKICNRCKNEKELTQFRKAKGYKNGINTECKACEKERLYEWRKNNPEKYKKQHKRDLEKRKATGWAYNLKYKKEKYVKHPRILLPREERAKRESEQKRRWKKNNPELVRADIAFRRAKRKGSTELEMILPNVVFERDKGICQICKTEVIGKYELDHIIPVSKGGQHLYSNIQLAHVSCNRKKHNHIIEATMVTDL
jgi:5-methylcytosine-specific restriction endonuclease McrA